MKKWMALLLAALLSGALGGCSASPKAKDRISDPQKAKTMHQYRGGNKSMRN